MTRVTILGLAFLLKEIGPTWHPSHSTSHHILTNQKEGISYKFPQTLLVSKSSPISHTACTPFQITYKQPYALAQTNFDEMKDCFTFSMQWRRHQTQMVRIQKIIKSQIAIKAYWSLHSSQTTAMSSTISARSRPPTQASLTRRRTPSSRSSPTRKTRCSL